MRNSILKRASRKIARIIKRKLDNFLLKKMNFIIVSNNCWGGEFYKHFNLPFNTPFIGLYLYPDCYIKLLKNWPDVMHSELKFRTGNKSKYKNSPFDFPIGVIDDDIEIHFMHYSSEEEAKSKWQRRTNRMLEQMSSSNSNLYFKLCDKCDATMDQIKEFQSLPFKNKVSFTQRPFEIENNISLLPQHLEDHETPTGIQLFFVSQYYFDIVYWINNGIIKTSFLQAMFKRFIL
jgi:uncharacterized protein (DUF1919 family)